MPKLLPHLFSDEGADAGEHLHEPFEVGLIKRLGLVAFIDENHHGRNGGVEGDVFEVAGHLFDQGGIGTIELMGILVGDLA